MVSKPLALAVGVVCLGTSCFASGGVNVVNAAEVASDQTLQQAANDPAVLGGSGLQGKQVDYAKDLASAIAAYRGNVKTLISLLAPNAPVFAGSGPPPNRAGMQQLINKYGRNENIPLGACQDYINTLGPTDDDNLNSYLGGDALILLQIANDEAEILLLDGVAASSVRQRVNNLEFIANAIGEGIKGDQRQPTIDGLQRVEPMLDQLLNNPPSPLGNGGNPASPSRTIGGPGTGTPTSPGTGAGAGSTPGLNSSNSLGNKLGANYAQEAVSDLPSPEDPVAEPQDPDQDAIYKQVQTYYKPDLDQVSQEVVIDGSQFPKEIDFGTPQTDNASSQSPDAASGGQPDTAGAQPDTPAPAEEPQSPVPVPDPSIQPSPYDAAPTLDNTSPDPSDPTDSTFKAAWDQMKEKVGSLEEAAAEKLPEWLKDKVADAVVDKIQDYANEEAGGEPKPSIGEPGYIQDKVKDFIVDKVIDKVTFDNYELDGAKDAWNALVYATQGFYKGLYQYNVNHMKIIQHNVNQVMGQEATDAGLDDGSGN